MLEKARALFLLMSVMTILMLISVLSVAAQTPSINRINRINPINATNSNAQTESAMSAISAIVAASSTPEIGLIRVIESGDNPLVQIDGKGFGKNPNNVKVIFNDNGVLVSPGQVKNKKIIVQVPNTNLCTGQVKVRVIVNTTSSNTFTFSYEKNAPVIYNLIPEHAKAGSVVEIKADNLACDVGNNLVTVNDIPVAVLGINMDKLTIRIPETFSSGKVKIRLTVGSQASLAKDFTIDSNTGNGSNGGNSGSDNKLVFLSSSPAGASFAPMFAIREVVTVNNVKTNLWDAMFYGTHQAVIDLPWKTVEGVTQKGLLTINFREVNGIYGASLVEKQRFIYALVQFPKDPSKVYHPENNPFFWGACSAATESSPSGGFIFNSLGRATGGIDSFEIAKDASTNGKAKVTMTLVAPDLGVYEDYGINYSKAGTAETRLPKLMTITVEMQNIEPSTPASQFKIGKITFNDSLTARGVKVTENAVFANTFSLTDVVDLFGFGSFR